MDSTNKYKHKLMKKHTIILVNIKQYINCVYRMYLNMISLTCVYVMKINRFSPRLFIEVNMQTVDNLFLALCKVNIASFQQHYMYLNMICLTCMHTMKTNKLFYIR